MNLVEAGWGGMEWIVLAQDRYKWRALLNVEMNRKPLSGCTTGGVSSSA
jgi:hypothetical protein